MVFAVHHMVNRARVLKTQLARHGGDGAGGNGLSQMTLKRFPRVATKQKPVDLRLCGIDPFPGATLRRRYAE
jgi:hypothetical protein